MVDYYQFEFPIRKDGIDQMFRLLGRNYAAYEPSYPPNATWLHYNAKGLLNNEEVWENYFHVMTLRHPVDRIFSHLFFSSEMWTGCLYNRTLNSIQYGQSNFTSDQLLEDLIFAFVDGRCEEMCSPFVCDSIDAVTTDFYVKHLSGSPPDLVVAAYNMIRYIDRPIDLLHYHAAAMGMCNRDLGWQEIIPQRKGDFTSEYQVRFPRLYDRLLDYTKDDIVLYDLAMYKMRLVQIRSEVMPLKEDDEVLSRQRMTWNIWTSHLR